MTSCIEMPVPASAAIVSKALSTSSVRLAPRPPVIAKGLQRRRRDRVHGGWADEFLDIDHVSIIGGPWCWCWPRGGAGFGRHGPPVPASVGCRRVRDIAGKSASHWRSPLCPIRLRRQRLFIRHSSRLQASSNKPVDHRVDAADKETGHAGDAAEITVPCSERLKAGSTPPPPVRRTLCEKSNVTLTLMPSPINCRIAGMPSSVAGTLIIRFGRATPSTGDGPPRLFLAYPARATARLPGSRSHRASSIGRTTASGGRRPPEYRERLSVHTMFGVQLP